jgi:hypothetical protein
VTRILGDKSEMLEFFLKRQLKKRMEALNDDSLDKNGRNLLAVPAEM